MTLKIRMKDKKNTLKKRHNIFKGRKNVMIYEKDKIRRLIDYKDKITDNDIKNDLEWILEQYNSNYITINDYESKEQLYNRIMKEYYNFEDEKMELQDTITKLKNKCKTLRRIYRELEVKYKESCKKLKSMI